jgi:aldehyde:ferredoxin oxidoreductase
MHDPRCLPSLATSYQLDATPARHTQFNAWACEGKFGMIGIEELFGKVEKYKYSGKGKANRIMGNFTHVIQAAGMCLFGALVIPYKMIPEFLSGVMGQEFSVNDVIEIGDRIATIRTAFNVREGIISKIYSLHHRMIGVPPAKVGPLAGVTVDVETQNKEYLVEMGWDPQTGIPTEDTLKRLHLDFCVTDLQAARSTIPVANLIK